MQVRLGARVPTGSPTNCDCPGEERATSIVEVTTHVDVISPWLRIDGTASFVCSHLLTSVRDEMAGFK
jgi:hypothetical protein